MNFKKNVIYVILIVDDTPIELKVLFDFLEFYGFKILEMKNAQCPSKIVSSSGNIFLRLL